MASNDSLNTPSSYNEEGYVLGKENMRIFIEMIDYDISKVVKKIIFVPTYQINGFVENKDK